MRWFFFSIALFVGLFANEPMCMLDYQLNPNGKDNLPQCQEIASSILYLVSMLQKNSQYSQMIDDLKK